MFVFEGEIVDCSGLIMEENGLIGAAGALSEVFCAEYCQILEC